MDLALSFSSESPYVDKGKLTPLAFVPYYTPDIGCIGFDTVVGPIANETTDVVARTTRLGIENTMQAIVYGNSFKITEMAVGTGGYDTSSPTKALPIDRQKTSLDGEIFRKPIDFYETPNTSGTKGFVCRFHPTDFVGGVGEVALIATFLSHVVPSMVGTKFVFALGHVGLQTKTQHSVVTYRVYVTP